MYKQKLQPPDGLIGYKCGVLLSYLIRKDTKATCIWVDDWTVVKEKKSLDMV